MTAPNPRRGGLEVCAPSVVPPIGVELSSEYGTWQALGETLTAAEGFTRNFGFCAVEDKSPFVQRDRIGVDNVMLEADLPALRLHVATRSTNNPRTNRRSAARRNS